MDLHQDWSVNTHSLKNNHHKISLILFLVVVHWFNHGVTPLWDWLAFSCQFLCRISKILVGCSLSVDGEGPGVRESTRSVVQLLSVFPSNTSLSSAEKPDSGLEAIASLFGGSANSASNIELLQYFEQHWELKKPQCLSISLLQSPSDFVPQTDLDPFRFVQSCHTHFCTYFEWRFCGQINLYSSLPIE